MPSRPIINIYSAACKAQHRATAQAPVAAASPQPIQQQQPLQPQQMGNRSQVRISQQKRTHRLSGGNPRGKGPKHAPDPGPGEKFAPEKHCNICYKKANKLAKTITNDICKYNL